MDEFWLNFHWNLFLEVHLVVFQHWVRQWLGAEQASTMTCLRQFKDMKDKAYLTYLHINNSTAADDLETPEARYQNAFL